MKSTLKRTDPWFGWMFLSSLAIHLACYILLVKFHYYTLPLAEGPVYYVDVVNLPVADPRAGTPSTTGSSATPSPAREEMAIPAPSPKKAVVKLKTPAGKKPAAPTQTARQFEERMAKIEQEVAAKHTSAALDAIKKKIAGSGKGGQTGIPGGKGMEAGSDYAGYIRSRLTDAFRTTISFQTKNPEVMVRLTIDRTGKVAGLKLERSSNDRIFEDAVINAIVKAEQTFVPPPGGGKFEYSFRFAPEGVSKK
jgi:colicin import membrane protein